jgi:hypothetical protein
LVREKIRKKESIVSACEMSNMIKMEKTPPCQKCNCPDKLMDGSSDQHYSAHVTDQKQSCFGRQTATLFHADVSSAKPKSAHSASY